MAKSMKKENEENLSVSKLKVLRNEKNLLELEFVDEDIAYLYALREYVVRDKTVEMCAVKKEHPEDAVANPKMLIKGDNPVLSLKKALEELIKETVSIYNKVK